MEGSTLSTRAFDGLAGAYEGFRPSYPRALIDLAGALFRQAAQATGRGLVLDVGAGTGISTRQLLQSLGGELDPVGIEPNEDMRLQGQRQAVDGSPRYVAGVAEALPAGDGAACGIFVAQALQWFDRPRFYAEAVRALAPGGAIAIVQNNRDFQGDELLDRYESLLERLSPGYSRFYRAFSITDELAAVAELADIHEHRQTWRRDMTEEQFLGMAESSTKVKAAMDAVGHAEVLAEIRNLVRPYLHDGQLSVPYVTELYTAQRR
jgi:ubiquinone/menaquinone biosynthesis C-methylase UbiE